MTETLPIVSVVVPAYNAEEHLPRCLESILNQDYPFIEVLIVNDGSVDGTSKIAESYASTDRRIFILDKENGGLPLARKSGFEASRGEYVIFVDSDDWIESDMILGMLAAATATDADIVSCDVRFVYEDGRRKSWIKGIGYDLLLSREEAFEALYKQRAVFQYAWNKLFRRKVLEKSDFNNIPSTMGEDYFTVLKPLSRAHKICHVGKSYYSYFQRSGCMCQEGYAPKHGRAFQLYIDTEAAMVEAHPGLNRLVSSYTSTELMWTLLPMARNGRYDSGVIEVCRIRFRREMPLILRYQGVGAYEKCAMFLFSMSPKLFFAIYYFARYGKWLPSSYNGRRQVKPEASFGTQEQGMQEFDGD